MDESLLEIGYPADEPFLRAGENRTVPRAFWRTVGRFRDAVAMRLPDDSVRLTWGEVGDRVRVQAGALKTLGLGAGETVALFMGNRPEHQIADIAASNLGAVTTSIYTTLPAEDVVYNVEDSGSRILITEAALAKVARQAVRDHGLDIDHLIVLDADVVDDLPGVEVRTFDEFIGLSAPEGFDFEATWRAVSPDDIATVIYTSGTTGRPKGVELSHGAVIHTVDGYHDVAPLEAGRRLLSAMPMAHIGERIISFYLALLQGHCVTFCSDLRQLNDMYIRVRPAMIFLTPRSLERFWAMIEADIAATADVAERVRKERARVLSAQIGTAQQEGATLDEARMKEWDELADVRRGLLAVCGLDAVEYAVIGGAFVPVDLMAPMVGLGLPAREGYGCTESGGVSTPGRMSDSYRVGYCGPPASGMEVRLAADGEVLVRGPRVMRGYRNQPEATKEAIDSEGWLHTGDLGVFNELGQLRIVDRKKDIIINSNGKNLSPARIEAKIVLAGSMIGTAVVAGESRAFVTALLVPDKTAVDDFSRRNPELQHLSLSELIQAPEFRGEFEAQIEKANRGLSTVEQVRRWTILASFWSPGSDKVTASNKLRRQSVLAKYSDAIDAMYAGRDKTHPTHDSGEARVHG